jgi:hypothetical protein
MQQRVVRAGSAVWMRVSSAAASGVSEDEEASSDSICTFVDWNQTDMDDGSKLTGAGGAPQIDQGDDLFEVDFRSRVDVLMKHNIDIHEKVNTEAGDQEVDVFRRRTDSPKTRKTVNWESVAEEQQPAALPRYRSKSLPCDSIASSADADSRKPVQDVPQEGPGHDLGIAHRDLDIPLRKSAAPVPSRPVSSPVYKQRHRRSRPSDIRSRLSDIAASASLSASLTPLESAMWNSQAAQDDFLATYLLKGKISEQLSTPNRQVIIIDDRKPLSHDMFQVNIGGGLALPPKKIPSSVGVRERELLIAQRKLDEIANMFVKDRESGGPETRRMKALGDESKSAADLRKELFGVDTAVCPTCRDKINPQHQHHFCVQHLLERQEKWEEDGCFGHAPHVTCRHKHSHTAYDVLSRAAERKAKGIGEKPREPQSPDGVSAWGSGESTTELLRNMEMMKPHAPPQSKNSSFQRKRSASSPHVAAHLELGTMPKTTPYDQCNASEKGPRNVESLEKAPDKLKSSDNSELSGQASGIRESSDRALKPHQTGLDESKGVGNKPDGKHSEAVGDKGQIEQVREQIAKHAEALLAQVATRTVGDAHDRVTICPRAHTHTHTHTHTNRTVSPCSFSAPRGC